jgi:hypothetical protein
MAVARVSKITASSLNGFQAVLGRVEARDKNLRSVTGFEVVSLK